MNTELMTSEEIKNYEMQRENFKQQAKLTALNAVPKTMQVSRSQPFGNTMSYVTPETVTKAAEQITKEAEIIYQWLIKTDA